MPRELTFLPFTGFSPGGAAHGGGLDMVKNLLPIYGGKRSLRKKAIQASSAGVDDPFTGLFVHIFAENRSVQFLRPDADTAAGIWEPSEETDEAEVLFALVDEQGPNDGDYILAGGAPVAEAVVLRLSDATTPGALTDHKILWRYAIENYAAQKSGSVTSITRAGTTATLTTAAAHGLATGDVAGHAGANQAEYNVDAVITVTGASTYTYEVSGTPASPATGTITWKQGWKAKIELLEAGVVVDPGAAPVEDVAIGSSSTSGPGTRTLVLTSTAGGQADAITDYDDLSLRVTASVPGPAQKLRPSGDAATGGWTTQAGAATNLYQQIDEATADDADYVTSGHLAAGTSRTYLATLAAGVDPLRSTGHTLRYRYFAANTGMTLSISLKQGPTTIKTTSHASIAPGSWIAGSLSLSGSEADAISDYDDLKLELAASYPSNIASTQDQYAYPVSDADNDGWARDGGAESRIDLFQYIDEEPASASDGIVVDDTVTSGGGGTTALAPPHTYTAVLESLPDPQTNVGHKLEIYHQRTYSGASAKFLTVDLRQGASTIVSQSVQYRFVEAGTSGPTTTTISLTEAQAAGITDYANLQVRLIAPDADVTYATFRARLVTPERRLVRVSWAEMELPSTARAILTWTEMQVPSADTEYRGDIPTIYVGKKTNLYVADPTGFTSVGSGYAAGTIRPGGWHMTSWGEDVIATNYVDDVQIRRAGTGTFGTMITSTDVPKARFVATVRNFVQLGDINLSGHGADEVWWSAFEDETDFDPSTATLCDFQPLKATQGQVMGMVGGEYGVIFKRNALHLQTWVGFPDVFRFDTTSRSVGTSAPRSIVTADGIIYFWDGSSFRKTTGYEEPTKIGSDVLSRFLTDYEFSDEALKAFQPADIREEDLAFSGAYDPHSGLIAWTYYGAGDSEPARKGRVLFYDPANEQWSFGKVDEGLDVTQLATYPNTLNDDTHPLKGLIGISYDGTDRAWFKLAGAATYAAQLRTKRVTLGDESTVLARLHGVYPVFEVKNEASLPANLSITVRAANDPRFVTNVRSETYALASANEYQRFPHRLEGRWWEFTVEVPELTSKALTSFVGLYLEWEPGGEA